MDHNCDACDSKIEDIPEFIRQNLIDYLIASIVLFLARYRVFGHQCTIKWTYNPISNLHYINKVYLKYDITLTICPVLFYDKKMTLLICISNTFPLHYASTRFHISKGEFCPHMDFIHSIIM